MTIRRGMTGWRALGAAALAGAALGGCGGSGDRTPTLSGLPLVRGAHVEVSKRTCDRGANAYCALQVVVADSDFHTSQGMLSAEQQLLRRRHWAKANAPVGEERAADAPGDRMRVTYATPTGELQSVELGWVKRVRPITLALSRALFQHTTALSVDLSLGTG